MDSKKQNLNLWAEKLDWNLDEESAYPNDGKPYRFVAADCVYDEREFNGLSRKLKMELSKNRKNTEDSLAIFATTIRNRETFSKFEKALEKANIRQVAQYTADQVPNIFNYNSYGFLERKPDRSSIVITILRDENT